MFPTKSVGGGGGRSHIVVGTITAVPSGAAAGSNKGLFELPKVSVKSAELISASREQASEEG